MRGQLLALLAACRACGYDQTMCFRLCVVDNNETIEVGDGGLVPWTQTLLGNRKERLMISGLSLERLALLQPPT